MTSASRYAFAAGAQSQATRRWLLAAALPLVFMPKQALALADKAQIAIKNVAKFDAAVWSGMLKSGPRPAAYVFTTTTCATCPEVFELLHEHIGAAGRSVALSAVVMDAQGSQALRHAHHYHGASRVFAFDGFAPAIRQAVDPQWRNITPYVVLLGPGGTVQRCIGPPSATMLSRWLV